MQSRNHQGKGNVLLFPSNESKALQKKQSFYKELLGDLQVVKIAWRNPTMHIVKKYHSDEAEQIYHAVKQFLKRLVDAGLHE